MTNKKSVVAWAVLIITAIILVSGGIAQAQGQPPDVKNATTFMGSVSINGAVAPDGTCIQAFGGSGGTDCPDSEGMGTTNGRYSIIVLFQGAPETITFSINGATAAQTWPLKESDKGKTISLNLSLPAGGGAGSGGGAIEIRGEVAEGPFEWDAYNFGALFYDFNGDIKTENLDVSSIDGRTIPVDNLVYSTSPIEVSFSYPNFGKYQAVGFMGDKYFAGYTDKTGVYNGIPITTRPSTDFRGISALSQGELHRVLLDDNTKRNISIGGTLALQDGYVLKATDIDINARTMLLSLLKDGNEVDISPLAAGDTYVYSKTVGSVENLPLIMVRFDSVFSGQELTVAYLKGLFQISESATTVKTGDQFGQMVIKTVSSDIISMSNYADIGLDKNTNLSLMEKINLRVADSDILRYYPFLEYTQPGKYEIRGNVMDQASGSTAQPFWNAQSFAGFYYDFKSNRSTETLSIKQNLNMMARTIPEKTLFYNTSKVPVQFKVNEKENITVDGDAAYPLVGWQGEKWIAVKNVSNKLTRLVLEMGKDESKTLIPGEKWALGGGYELTVNAIDTGAIPNQVWFTIKEDGKVIDEGIGQAPQSDSVADKQKAVYFKKTTILGESDALLFTVYIDSISSGSVTFKYAWLIDQSSAVEIKTSDMFGVFEVTRADSDTIALWNKNSVALSKNTETTLMGNMKFRTADSDFLRFYLTKDYIIPDQTVPPSSLSILINNGDLRTNSPAVTLSVYADNAAEMSFSNDNITWSTWESYALVRSWELKGEFGSNTVYFRARNAAGNTSPVSATIALLTTKPSSRDKVEVRGTVIDQSSGSTAQPFWNAHSFAGFYYDLKNDRSTETLSINQNLNMMTRTIPEKTLYYNTTKASVQFKVNEKEGSTVDSDATYKIVGWQGEKWIAVKNTANKLARLAFEMDKDDKKTLAVGETWALGAGYELTIDAIDVNATTRQVRFTLKKGGIVVDEGIGQAPQGDSVADKQKAVYLKKVTMLGESDALLFTVYVNSIFRGATSDIVQFKYAWLIDQSSAVEIKASDMFGVFEVTRADPDAIALWNKNSVALSKNTEAALIGNMKFKIADNDILRFYPFVLYTKPGIYEVRGTVIDQSSGSAAQPFWDAQTFAGFDYDLKYNRSTETLSINQNLNSMTRTIPEKTLFYKTGKASVQFKANEKEGITVNGDAAYPLVGWQGDKWIAVNNVSNKLARLVFEMEKDDKKTIITGETWALGSGYELTINAVDARATPRQVWFTLKKDGKVIDEGIGQAPQSSSIADKQKAVYFKKLTILGESDALLFTVYVNSIFSGATSDMVQFKYAWLIDQSSAKEIQTSDTFGVFEAARADADAIELWNKNSVSLSKNTETTLMGNMKFKTADSDTLRFYLKKDYAIPDQSVPPSALAILINRGDIHTNSLAVKLGISADNATEMSFSNDNIVWSPWETYSETRGWMLKEGDGLKTVYFRARNAAGIASPVSDTISLLTTNPLSGDKVEIRGTVIDQSSGSTAQPFWNAQSFAGFYYDLKNSISTETLTIRQNLNSMSRTIPEKTLFYSTSKAPVQFKANEIEGVTVDGDTAYPLVGWQGEKWIAVKNVSNKLAKLVFEMGANDKKTLTTGETWSLGAGYELTIDDINAISSPRQVKFTLKKNGAVIDEGIGQAPQSDSSEDKQKAVYFKKLTILGESDSLLFTIYVDSIFRGATSDMVQFKYAWLIDQDSAVELKTSDMFGVFEVTRADSDAIELWNKNSVSLSKNTETTLMGNMKFRTADNDSLRFYPFIVYTQPGTYEVRGIVIDQSSGSTAQPFWNAQSFAGFYYDLKFNRSTETLSIKQNLNTMTRTIPEKTLFYNTTKTFVQFKVNEKEGITVDGDATYPLVGWQGEKWIAVNNVCDKLARLVFEMEKDDTKTLISNETWALGAGYELTINAVDARATPRQVWFTLKKDGVVVDEGIGQAPQSGMLADKQKAVYFKTVTMLGESDALLFTVYVDSIFSSTTSDMVQFKYAWLIDQSSAVEIKTSDTFGVFEVTRADSDAIALWNKNPVDLSKNTETTLMGSMKFRIADSDTLRFYLKKDYTIPDQSVPPSSLSILINNGDLRTNSPAVTLSVYADNATEMSFSNDNITWSAWESYAQIKSWKLKGDFGSNMVYFRARNAAGVASPVSATISLLTAKTLSQDKVELRGTVIDQSSGSTAQPFWNAQSFAGFYYDLKNDRSTETLSINQNLNMMTRTIPEKTLFYNTTKTFVQFKVNEKEGITVDGDAAYPLVGWQAGKWIAVKNVSNKLARLVFEMEKDDKKTLTTGDKWILGAGYELTINAVDASATPRQVWFTLKKDGAVVDEGIGQAPQSGSSADKQKAVYFKKLTILGESDALLFTVYVDSIFSGATSDMVQFKYAWLIDQGSAVEIKVSDMFGVFEVARADSDAIAMWNKNPVNLSKDTETTLMGTMKFRIADSDILRFYPFVVYTQPGTYEVRGTVIDQFSDTAQPFWNAQSFAGFYYDLKFNRSTETLSIQQNLNTMTRTIPEKTLFYNTTKAQVQFKVNEKENITVDDDATYPLVGWQAEKWIAVNNVCNKLAKLVFEMERDDKKTLATGETWALGAGYELTIDAIDVNATPRQVWFTLKKGGEVVDEGIGQAPQSDSVADKQKAIYFKKLTILGESDSLLFTVYVDSIFRGATSDMVQFKYAWLIDQSSAVEIKASDMFGVFEVIRADSDAIALWNKNSLALSKNTEPTLIGNMKFKIADSDILRFYPKIDYMIPETANGTIAGTITNVSMVPIAGVTVIADGKTGVTNDTGYYTISIAPGTYNVTASTTGYVTNSTTGVQVAYNATTTVDLTLTPSPKGDLDDDGGLDQRDEDLLREVVLGERQGDSRFDLNHNGIAGDIGDLILLRRAIIDEIELP